MNEWISVTERLPDFNRFVLAMDKFGDVVVAFRCTSEMWEINCNCGEVSEMKDPAYWVPIPFDLEKTSLEVKGWPINE